MCWPFSRCSSRSCPATRPSRQSGEHERATPPAGQGRHRRRVRGNPGPAVRRAGGGTVAGRQRQAALAGGGSVGGGDRDWIRRHVRSGPGLPGRRAAAGFLVLHAAVRAVEQHEQRRRDRRRCHRQPDQGHPLARVPGRRDEGDPAGVQALRRGLRHRARVRRLPRLLQPPLPDLWPRGRVRGLRGERRLDQRRGDDRRRRPDRRQASVRGHRRQPAAVMPTVLASELNARGVLCCGLHRVAVDRLLQREPGHHRRRPSEHQRVLPAVGRVHRQAAGRQERHLRRRRAEPAPRVQEQDARVRAHVPQRRARQGRPRGRARPEDL